MLDEAFDLFAKAAPATVMVRGILENILSANRLNAIFEDASRLQYTRDLAFSSVVRLMSQVVIHVRPSVNAAYKEEAKELNVSAKCVYDKLAGIEPQVSREVVRRTAREMELVIRMVGGTLAPLLPGYRVRILDGNHLGGTDRRLGLLRGVGGAALPGQALAVLDPELKLFVDLFPCEDAYTQERALLSQVLPIVEAGDLWIEDRNFCTRAFLFGIARKNAAFLVRHHAGLPWEPLGDRIFVGECETGRVFEQSVRLVDGQGKELVVRRITIELYQATRDGETVLHLLTNLPAEHADALTVARLYPQRWQVETAFQEMTVDLRCEVNTLGYPKAALFAFSVAALCYNAFSVTKAALRAAHPSPDEPEVSPCPVPASGTLSAETEPAPASPMNSSCQLSTDEPSPSRTDAVPAPSSASSSPVSIKRPDCTPPARDWLSTYYLADEIAGTWRGMMVVLPDSFWKEKFADLSPVELANTLTDLASRADVDKYRQRPPSQRRSTRNPPCRPGSHVSTARVLENGHQPSKC